MLEDLPPSLHPRSVPLTMMPPPKRASRTALILAIAAWVIVAVVFLLRNELGDEFARVESWRSTLRRAALGASGILALGSTIPAVRGLSRAPVQSVIALLLAAAWIALMVWRFLH